MSDEMVSKLGDKKALLETEQEEAILEWHRAFENLEKVMANDYCTAVDQILEKAPNIFSKEISGLDESTIRTTKARLQELKSTALVAVKENFQEYRIHREATLRGTSTPYSPSHIRSSIWNTFDDLRKRSTEVFGSKNAEFPKFEFSTDFKLQEDKYKNIYFRDGWSNELAEAEFQERAMFSRASTKLQELVDTNKALQDAIAQNKWK
ncbi:MAG: hypothetical protein KF824_09740 [Fimbriimonadaceae bacterium]|nr:MAG: hypothetical protein KF824_09740 [Fimbriimonadaceae bacterium]